MLFRSMALHDSLTGLPNRTLLETRLSQAIAGSSQTQIAVSMLDLDHFTNINDSLGHDIGNHLIRAVSKRLQEDLGGSNTIARLGGDEFVIVVPIIEGRAEVERFAQRIMAAFEDPFEIDHRSLRISASVGISQFPADGDNPAALLQFADAAMHEAQRRGRGRVCFFSPALTDASRYRQQIENELFRACSRDEFILHYQPIVDLRSGKISGVEALLRWRHPKLGLIPPDRFIPQLEDMGLMTEIGRWVMKTACRQAAEWQQSGLPVTRMAVNISAQQFYEGNLVGSIKTVLHETQLSPALLELELTEGRKLDDSPLTLNIMGELKRLGLSLSLDDFGTGWSSLSYLRRFPIDRIKIDRSFVRDVLTQPAAEAVVKSILGLSRTLGIASLAEGVETREQREYFRAQNCAEFQGFFFSQPVTACDITAMLRAPSGHQEALRMSDANKIAAAV